MIKEGVFLGKRYEILGRIGSGGMADVYKGKDHKLNRYVAVKVLKNDYRTDKVFIQKFVSEAQSAAGLLHPNVVNVYDVGQDRGLYYMVMELVEGITLKEYIEKKRRLSAKETISIAIQMVSGIQAAHNKHIIHRDIKPQNIIISRDGKVKVTDFGIARATNTTNTISTNVMGSVHYTSPEHARGGIVDEKSDIYSVGITMYEMITGHVPFDGDSTVAVAIKHLQEEIMSPAEEVPNMPYSLECIIMKCTQKNADRRYRNCQELIADLKRSLVDPDGDFVYVSPYAEQRTGTVVMSTEELRRVQRKRYPQNEDDYDEEDDYDDDDEYDDDYDEGDDAYMVRRDRREQRNSDTKQIMKVLLIAAAAILVLAIIFMAANASGFFNLDRDPLSEEEEEKVEVPSLLGKTEDEARAALRGTGLGYSVDGREASDEYEEGQIMRQTPEAGEEVDKNTEIKVIVSTGPEIKTVEVPDVIGKDEAQAQKMLEDANLVVDAEAEYNDDVEAGKVISTDPKPGIEVDEGSRVKMVVSMGKEQVSVPSVRGMSLDNAGSTLRNAGLDVGSVTEQYDDSASGTVISQGISSGTKVDRGTTVDLVISKGKEMVTVPPVEGYDENVALQRLQNAGLRGRVVAREYSDDFSEGYVMKQSIRSGSSTEKNTEIELTVSKGPDPSKYPSNGGTSGDDNP